MIIDVHPVWRDDQVYGSAVVVRVPADDELLAAAILVEDPPGRRVYYGARFCTPSS